MSLNLFISVSKRLSSSILCDLPIKSNRISIDRILTCLLTSSVLRLTVWIKLTTSNILKSSVRDICTVLTGWKGQELPHQFNDLQSNRDRRIVNKGESDNLHESTYLHEFPVVESPYIVSDIHTSFICNNYMLVPEIASPSSILFESCIVVLKTFSTCCSSSDVR
jgi:hypothetical protein